jgi:hypothetical protein
MRIEQALRVRDSLKIRINDLYSCARLSGMTSAEIQQSKSKIFAEIPRKPPAWVRSYCDGYIAALQAELYRDWLVHGGYIDGIFYSTHSKRNDYYEKHAIEPAAYADDRLVKERGHYWSDSVQYYGGIYSRAAVKPYFIG